MTNFDYLQSEKKFYSFSGIAITAEKLYQIDIPSCVFNIRRALEFAVKWMYSVDSSLVMPYQDNLVSLINTEEFRKIINDSLFPRIEYIRKLGNNSSHSKKNISAEQAELGLQNLFYFLDFIAYCYADNYEEHSFNPKLLCSSVEQPKTNEFSDIDINNLIEENKSLKEKLTKRREENIETYSPKPLELTEYKTRKIYIDTMLQDAGWTEGKDWQNEYELSGMPNQSQVGYADYVLFGDDGKPLAIIEAKRTCKDVAIGRQQAKLYADLLEKKFKKRPIIFLSNGFDTRIWNDKYYPEHKVSGFYSKRDLEKEFNKLTMRTKLTNIQVNDNISNRYYQKEAVKAVCCSFDELNHRKALLVMATGSGKTRTVISIVDVLINHGWVKNILFLADRNSLVTQAKRSFVNLLPNLSITNLCEEKDNLSARAVFSTYQTMMNCIDDAKDENGGKLFTIGHFDLIICDEAHRSIYNKYKDIFTYFDAMLVGLTATPRGEIDKNTYNIFDLENGVPTYGYELEQAVQDEFLVDFESIETKLKFIEKGITYDDLSEQDREEYEKTFADSDGEIPESINSSAINEWIFNKDTIKKVLNALMTDGIKIDYGSKIGKTIIFAKNHKHAEKIYEIFGKEYPNLPNFCRVIDNYTNYSQSLIDEFSDKDKLPQIVVSVDMLDTGIDVPEVVNLVFFKKVMSKSKFWQMIGRGTRLCKGLIDGKDKKYFYIFDFCSNFEFFRINTKGKEGVNTVSVQERIINIKVEMILKLQNIEYQTDELKSFRNNLINDVVSKVKELNIDNFAVKQHLRYVDFFSNKSNFFSINYEDTRQIAEEISPLIMPYDDEASAVRFDALIYGIEVAYLYGNNYSKAKHDLAVKVSAVSKVCNIPAVQAKSELIQKIIHTDYVETAGINEFEYIRTELRDIIKYIPPDILPIYDTTLTDDIISVEKHKSDLKNDDLQNYRNKVNFYIRQHIDEGVIAKLHTNKPLSTNDINHLEELLWSKLGTKDDYKKEYKDKPLGVLVREIIGLDMNAAKQAFSKYLNDVNMNDRQIYFVNQVINYIVQNGIMPDFKVMQETPFTDKGSVDDVFKNEVVFADILKIIKIINLNANVA